MQTKLTTALLLAAGALLASAGCSHQASTAPAAAVPTANPNPTPPTQAAAQALSNPNTSPDVKKYLQEHQSQIHQGPAAPAQARPAGGQ